MEETAVSRIDRKLARLGGLHAVLGIDRSNIYHWNRPSSVKNGRGGSIPDKYHGAILDAARKAGVRISKGDLVNA